MDRQHYGPFRIIDKLGEGGMSAVFRARDPRLGREVAVKVLSSDLLRDPERVARFKQEARATALLNHPNIITIYEIGQQEDEIYIVMELIQGQTLRKALSSGRLPMHEVLGLAAQAGAGLAKAHRAGIVHRDLKPDNIMINADGFLKILDFGIAKLVQVPGAASVSSEDETVALLRTHPGMVMGTPVYMSPEQTDGPLVDSRSDQFSLGSILYEMATGVPAFQRQNWQQTLQAIKHEQPPPVAALNPAVHPGLAMLVERCLAKDPKHRLASTDELARGLELAFFSYQVKHLGQAWSDQ